MTMANGNNLEKKTRNRILFIVLACVLFVGMAHTSYAASSKTIQDVTFRCAIKSDITTLDPNRAGRGATGFVLFYLCQGLGHPSGLNWRPLPCLADSWEMLNPTAWKFNLHKGITFHNGEPLTSADVQFSYYRQMGKLNRRYPGAAKAEFRRMIDRIETPDDYTVIIHTKKPEVSMLSYVLSGSVYIAPKDYVEAVGDRAFGKKPVGTGPFKFKERKPSEYIAFEANEKYWNTNPIPGSLKPPEIRHVQYRIIPKNQTAVAALLAGEVDGIQGLPSDIVDDLEKRPGINIFYTEQNMPSLIMMNWLKSKDEKTGEPNPFYDVRVRRAMNYALDLDTIIKSYGTGRERRTTLVGRGSIGYNPDISFYKYDPEKAKKLLSKAGYPNGFKTQMSVLSDRPPYVDAMTQYWRDIGVQVDYRITTLPVVIREMYRKNLQGMVVWVGGRGHDTTAGFNKIYLRGKGTFALHPPDERVEALIDKQQVEFDDKKRARLIHEVTKILWKDAWFIPLIEGVVIKTLRDEWEYDHHPSINSFYITHIRKK